MRTKYQYIMARMSRRLGLTARILAKTFSAKALRERMGELHDKCTALSNLAEKESRDLSEEEKAEFDGYMAEYKRIQEKDLPRAEWLEAEQERLASVRIDSRIQNGDVRGTGGQHLDAGTDGAAADGTDLLSRVKVPMRARLLAPAQLKSFRGPTAIEEAYISGQWLLANFYGNAEARKWCLDNGLSVRNSMAEGDNNAGGALVPEEFARTLIRLVEEYGTFRRKAFIWPMASETTTVPRQISDVTAYFVGENSEITDSEPGFDSIRLTARKLAALCKWPIEIDQDSAIAVADLLARSIAYAFAVKEDQCGFLGTGISTYGGISGLITELTTATAGTVTAITGNTAFSTLDLADFESLLGKLPMYPGINPEWYISKAGWAASMMRLADAAGGNTAADIEGMRRPMFLGFPVNLVQCMNSTLTAQTSAKGICYFGDLRMAATMGTRRGLQLAISDQRYFEYDQLAIKGTERVDINVHDVGDTSNAGAMVMLAMPGS